MVSVNLWECLTACARRNEMGGPIMEDGDLRAIEEGGGEQEIVLSSSPHGWMVTVFDLAGDRCLSLDIPKDRSMHLTLTLEVGKQRVISTLGIVDLTKKECVYANNNLR